MAKKELKDEIKMITAINEALKVRKANPKFDSEHILKHMADFVRQEKDEKLKMAMIASSAKAIEIKEKFNFLSDKEVIRKIMPELKQIKENVE